MKPSIPARCRMFRARSSVALATAAGLGLLAPLGAGLAGLAPVVAAAAPGLPSTNVAWVPAANDADVDAAFARARAERKPVLLYWGASWCPPCNRLKATLFNRQDFAEQARGLVAVHVDGDRPGAQKVGARFQVRGYPTLIVFAPDGTEITRLPGEVEASQVVALLQQGLAGGRPVAAVLADARAGRSLSAAEWRALAFYAWDADRERLARDAERPLLLAELAGRCRDETLAQRLWLRALAESDDGKGLKADAALRQRVDRVLADPVAARAQMDLLTLGAPELVRALTVEGSDERSSLLARYDGTLARLQAETSLARADRLAALAARVELARLALPPEALAGAPALPAPLLAEVKAQAARLDREVADGHERQAVITSAAWLLQRAGLAADSDALLESNLQRSIAPYYLMSQLSANARRRGDIPEALRWAEQAWQRSEGPATRLQWGASYVGALVDLAPTEADRIEQAASALLAQAAQDPSVFHERGAGSLRRAGSKLAGWGQAHRQPAVLQRLHRQLDGLCAKVASEQCAACRKVFDTGPAGQPDA